MSRNEHGEYACVACDYTTSRLSNFRRHVTTPKHQMVTNGNQKEQGIGLECPTCRRTYRHRSGLSRHRRDCGSDVGMVDPHHADILQAIVEDHSVMKSKLEHLANTPTSVTIAPKRMTLNVFLDVACKDAMNFDEFVERISVTMSDLDYSRENGYVEGMSNILARTLQGMSPLARPIHCSDKRRLIFYVKDDDAWQRDGKERIQDSLGLITQKQVMQIKEWERNHMGWENNEAQVAEWITVVRSVMGDHDPEQHEAEQTQVLRTLTATTELKYAMDSAQNEA